MRNVHGAAIRSRKGEEVTPLTITSYEDAKRIANAMLYPPKRGEMRVNAEVFNHAAPESLVGHTFLINDDPHFYRVVRATQSDPCYLDLIYEVAAREAK